MKTTWSGTYQGTDSAPSYYFYSPKHCMHTDWHINKSRNWAASRAPQASARTALPPCARPPSVNFTLSFSLGTKCHLSEETISPSTEPMQSYYAPLQLQSSLRNSGFHREYCVLVLFCTRPVRSRLSGLTQPASPSTADDATDRNGTIDRDDAHDPRTLLPPDDDHDPRPPPITPVSSRLSRPGPFSLSTHRNNEGSEVRRRCPSMSIESQPPTPSSSSSAVRCPRRRPVPADVPPLPLRAASVGADRRGRDGRSLRAHRRRPARPTRR